MYEVPCGECDTVYIHVGETGRNLQERIKEHKYTVKAGDMKNGIVAHAWGAQHPIDWSAAKVRTTEQIQYKRKVIETIHIQWEARNTLNLDCGLQLNSVWLPLIQVSK